MDRPLIMLLAQRSHWEDELKPNSAQSLQQAEQLAQLGFVRASVCIGRVALELGLAEVCRQRNCWPLNPATGERFNQRDKRSVPRFMASLDLAGYVEREMRERVSAASNLGNRGVHGHSIMPADAWYVLDVVRQVRRLADGAPIVVDDE